MLVTESTFQECIKEIGSYSEIAVDTETTGLFPYAGNNLFGISVSTKDKSYYFDYNSELKDATLSREKSPIANILNGYEGVVHMHNAKFDMAFLANEGVDVEGLKINCTYAVARIVDNSESWLTLDHLTRKLGHNKSDEVKKHILKHKLYEWIQRPGKKKREKNLFFYKVPLEVVQPYAEKDTEATLSLANHQINSIREQNKAKGLELKLDNLLQNERRLTKVFYRMERRGIRVDVRFTSDAYAYETKKYAKYADDFKVLTGKDFIDSGVLFALVFKEKGIPYPTTAKGNPCFDSDALKKCDNPLASIIKGCRDSYKKAGTFENILYYTYEDSLHSNARQAGCTTGRVSYSDPPMQCLEKVEEDDPSYNDKYLIRRCFVPREDYKFFMLDYDQMEYRMMLNYAGQLDLIDKIKGGLDVHTATAEMMGVPRKQAKCIAKGSLVLTDKGQIPIEEITLEHRIWDGESFCRHDGLIYKGIQEVISWDGVTSTLDHKVYTEDGDIYEMQFCKKYRIPLMVTGIKGEEVRFSNPNRPLFYGEWVSKSESIVRNMRRKLYTIYLKSLEQKNKELQMSKEHKAQDKSRGFISREMESLLSELQQSKVSLLEKLWSTWGTFANVLSAMGKIFSGEILSKTDFARRCSEEYKKRQDLAANSEDTSKVYDIQNVGYNFRFTVNGRCVKNCINFMLLYGGGSQKLADALGVSLNDAKDLKEKYFSVLPKVKSLISSCQNVVASRGFIHNWFGRRYHIDYDFCYKAPNYLIQGGCADWIKVAMVNIDNFLKDKKSKMLLQVHDELLFEVHKDEEEIVPILKYLMESVSYESPHLHLSYTVGVDWSDKNWQDKKPWEG